MVESDADFEALFSPHRESLHRYVRRLVGHRQDAEDLVQDSLVKALAARATLRDPRTFKSWLFQIATRTCIDHLRKKKRWRPFSQRYLEDECAQNDLWRQQIVDATRDEAFAYDVREHIAFCFACVGRSLAPDEHTAVVLRDVLGYTNREAADIVGVTESVLRHRLAAGRQSMQKTFDGLCSLINKNGVCRQCASFRKFTAEDRRGPSLPVLAPGDWTSRTDIVRENRFDGGKSSILHDLMFRRIDEFESAATDED